MAFTDNTANGRVVQAIGPRYDVLLGAACEAGDLLCYNSGWKLGNVAAIGTSDIKLVACEKGASATSIKATGEAIIGGLTAGTAGNSVYANSIGGYSATVGTVPFVAGFELNSSTASGGGAIYVKLPVPAIGTSQVAVGAYLWGGSSTGGAYTLRTTCSTAVQTVVTLGGNTASGTFGLFGKSAAQQGTISASTGGNTTVDAIIAVLDAFGLTATS